MRTIECAPVIAVPTEVEEIRRKKMAELVQRTQGTSGGYGWPDAPVTVTDSNFDEFIKKHKKVVLDCWAPWCGPCRMLSPTIDALAKEMKGKVVFGKVNTDENFGIAGKFRIMSIPTMLFFKNGKLVDRSIGAAPKETVERQVLEKLS